MTQCLSCMDKVWCGSPKLGKKKQAAKTLRSKGSRALSWKVRPFLTPHCPGLPTVGSVMPSVRGRLLVSTEKALKASCFTLSKASQQSSLLCLFLPSTRRSSLPKQTTHQKPVQLHECWHGHRVTRGRTHCNAQELNPEWHRKVQSAETHAPEWATLPWKREACVDRKNNGKTFSEDDHCSPYFTFLVQMLSGLKFKTFN